MNGRRCAASSACSVKGFQALEETGHRSPILPRAKLLPNLKKSAPDSSFFICRGSRDPTGRLANKIAGPLGCVRGPGIHWYVSDLLRKRPFVATGYVYLSLQFRETWRISQASEAGSARKLRKVRERHRLPSSHRDHSARNDKACSQKCSGMQYAPLSIAATTIQSGCARWVFRNHVTNNGWDEPATVVQTCSVGRTTGEGR